MKNIYSSQFHDSILINYLLLGKNIEFLERDLKERFLSPDSKLLIFKSKQFKVKDTEKFPLEPINLL